MCTACAEGQALLRHADGETADQVDDDDDEPGDGVALDEFHRAVHGAVKLALALQRAAQRARLGLGDVAVAQLVIDAHLLAGQRVEAEPGRDFGDALAALGDHHELRDGDDEEDDQADRDIAADDEIAERGDDLSGIRLQQNETRRGDGDREPEQGRDENDRRQRGKLRRRGDVEGDQQDQQRRWRCSG